jgi:hypothetical protein
MVYSVLLHICLLVVAYFNAGDVLFILLGKNRYFLTYTFNALMLFAVVVSCCIPVLFWLDCPKYVQYLNRWAEFQVTYTNISLMIRPIDILVYKIALFIKIKQNIL